MKIQIIVKLLKFKIHISFLGITLKSEELSGSKSLTLKATLSGGKGDVAWQHAQLFRSKMDQNDIQLKFIVKLSKSDK